MLHDSDSINGCGALITSYCNFHKIECMSILLLCGLFYLQTDPPFCKTIDVQFSLLRQHLYIEIANIIQET